MSTQTAQYMYKKPCMVPPSDSRALNFCRQESAQCNGGLVRENLTRDQAYANAITSALHTSVL